MSTTSTTVAENSSGKARVTNPPPRVALVDLTPNSIGTLRKLNSVLFPVSYSEKFYNQVLEEHLVDFCKLIYYNDLPVGAVCCRVEPDPKLNSDLIKNTKNGLPSANPDLSTKLYIMTLGILAPYRCQGLASKLLDQVIESAQKTHLSNNSVTPLIADPTPTAAEIKKSALKGKKSTVPKITEAQPNKESERTDIVQIPPISMAYVHVQFGNEDAKNFYLNRGFKTDGEIQEYYRKINPRGAWILTRQIEKLK
ncbi:hypothetical protein BY996DRAFT_6409419 [Phakopsora pachyrhizi]|uniref:N-acetyltransferase domain-containing protein n=1 Tax=Phakopsora pachyrhizi TaxID=170000 RepID=A0AAV0AHK1_PHAPC|nr:hypothetical protein BY996DRAFT_6409419 [Phakopsora pachyrhizi]CAH7666777.1 hypothetical protein PPACK8108_LOCUS1130 [Phakopsora pachyrhizi]